MTIKELMNHYIVRVDSHDDSAKLKQLILEEDKSFNFNGWNMNAGEGWYWCINNDELCFEWNHYRIPSRNIINVEEAIKKYAESKECLDTTITRHEMFNEHELSNLIASITTSNVDPHILTQLHVSFDGMTTHCIAKDKHGVIARSKAQAVGEDKENYDQLIGAVISVVKLVPEERHIEFFEHLMKVMGIGVTVTAEAKLVNVNER